MALVLFLLLAAAWLWPVWSADAIPGTGAGDNLTFLWNNWWMSQAMRSHAWPLHTPVLFAPFGVDLTLNTHTAAASAVAAVMMRFIPLAAATNIVLLADLFLNFVCAYALAWRLTRRIDAALLAALAFGWCPYIGARLAGHFNLVAAWVLPLTALLLVDALEARSLLRRVLLGLALGFIVFIDYYYAVYAWVLVACLAASRGVVVTRVARARQRWQSSTLSAVAAASALVLLGIGLIAATGGTALAIGVVRVSIRGTGNLVAALGVLACTAAAVAWVPGMRVHAVRDLLARDCRTLAVALIAAAIVASPVLLSLARLWQHGDYVTQRYFWRSAPAGVDVGSMVLGNPAGLAWGTLSSRAYVRLGIDPVEQVAWFGPSLIVLCAIALFWAKTVPSRLPDAAPAAYPPGPADRRIESVPTCRRKAGNWGQTPIAPPPLNFGVRPQVAAWAVVGGAFLLWAVGPYLVVFGRHVPLLLPATLVRFAPLVSNARIPARAIVGVYLAAAMLAAWGFTALQESGRGRLAWILFAALVVDFVPAPVTVLALDHPAIYDVLRDHSMPGAVCELPLGLRDGFGERGRFDARVLLYQTIHQRPIAGGFVARLPPRIVAAYDSDAILGPLLRLSQGRPLAAERPLDGGAGSDALRALGFRFVVVNRELAPPALLTFVQGSLRLRELAREGSRTLYEIVPRVSGE